jgi:hypothetical protein
MISLSACSELHYRMRVSDTLEPIEKLVIAKAMDHTQVSLDYRPVHIKLPPPDGNWL